MKIQVKLSQIYNLKGDWFNFLVILTDPLAKRSDPFYKKVQIIDSPKNLINLSENKAIGSIQWWRKITNFKDYPCFIYCPDEISIFNKNGSYNYNIIEKLVREQKGNIDFMCIK